MWVSVSAPRLYLSSKLCSSINLLCSDRGEQWTEYIDHAVLGASSAPAAALQQPTVCLLLCSSVCVGECLHSSSGLTVRRRWGSHMLVLLTLTISLFPSYFVLMMRMLIAIIIIMVPGTPYWISHLSLFGNCTFSECRVERIILLMILILI